MTRLLCGCTSRSSSAPHRKGRLGKYIDPERTFPSEDPARDRVNGLEIGPVVFRFADLELARKHVNPYGTGYRLPRRKSQAPTTNEIAQCQRTNRIA
jgi:hypothetical protein